jgi:hypothetical protein
VRLVSSIDLTYTCSNHCRQGSYRGFFTLALTPERAVATFYAMNNISYPNLDGFSSAVFEVKAGESRAPGAVISS